MDLLQIASSSGHFLQILHVINYKFNYAAPFSLSKLLQSWFYPSASLFDLFVSFLCLRLFSICRLLVLDTLLILWNVKRGSCFATTFHCCLLRMSCCILQCFSSLKVFLTLIIVMTKAIACMVVFSCLYPS